MNAASFHLAFKLGLDKSDSLNYPDFRPEEIDFFLNQAQERLVKQRYGLNNPKKQGFEETQKRTEDLKGIVKPVTIVPTANNPSENKPNGVFVTLPSDLWLIINEEVSLTYLNPKGVSTTSRIKVKPTKHDDYDNLILDPFNKPYEGEVVRLMIDGKVELITGASTQTINNYYLRYIKKPDPISLSNNTTTDLSEHLHDEIVMEACRVVIEDIESKRNATFTPILTTDE